MKQGTYSAAPYQTIDASHWIGEGWRRHVWKMKECASSAGTGETASHGQDKVCCAIFCFLPPTSMLHTWTKRFGTSANQLSACNGNVSFVWECEGDDQMLKGTTWMVIEFCSRL